MDGLPDADSPVANSPDASSSHFDRAGGLLPLVLDVRAVPDPDPALEPEGYLVTSDDGTRIHFHDWGGPPSPIHDRAAVVCVPGLLQPAWTWAPVARRIARTGRVVVVDLRGQGLSDAPSSGYDLASLAADIVFAAEGSGVLDDDRIVLAGHGFGAMVAAEVAARLGDRCAGLVCVDGGWERMEVTTGLDLDEFLRGLDEPPEVLRSMTAFLADRQAFDPATWDADQERAARDTVVETAAGHVLRAVRTPVVEALARAMFAYQPAIALASVSAPVSVLVALASGDAETRRAELRRTAAARVAAGLDPMTVAAYPDAHNLMRYRPAEVAAAILSAAAGATIVRS